MRVFSAVFFLSLNWLAYAAVLPQAGGYANSIATRAAEGLKSVVYYVNWVRISRRPVYIHVI